MRKLPLPRFLLALFLFCSAAPLFGGTILFLGDSLTAGLGVPEPQAYPALVQEKITAEHLPFDVVNAGLSGDTSAGGLSRLDWILQKPIDILVLALGANDGLRGLPIAQMETNLQAIIDKVKAKDPQAKIVVAGMQTPPNLGADYTAKFAAVFPELAQKNHAALVPFLLEGVGGQVDLNQADHIHPTPAGHKILAENIWKVLAPLLTKPGT